MSDFWTACLEQIKNDTPRDVFQTWFADLTADVELEAGSITILAPSSAKLRTVRDSYGTTITQYVNRLAGKEMDIVWAVAQSKPQRPFVEHIEEVKPDIAATGLLPNLTFENLVEGQANQMAFASALQVASSTHSVYNPLFIYGGVGLGKTHLMHAIGNRFLKNNPKAKVLCVSAQQYTQEFVDAMRLKNVNSERYTEAMRKFDARYRGIDMLLIDDIQSFRDREGTQTNFFLTFESMVPHGKQIVLTSDTYPKNLSEFQDRLLSRLTQGLIVMIEPPEFEMRIAILLNKAKAFNIDLPEEVATFIAKRLKSNVRELEGALQQVIAFQQFQPSLGKVITIDVAKRVLRDQFSVNNNSVTIENIQKTVADYYKIKVADMFSKRRPRNIALPRQIAMYLAKELTQHSLPEIGANFGGRDHTTVMHAVRKIAQERKTDADLELHVLKQIIIG